MAAITSDFDKWTIFKGFAFGLTQPVVVGSFFLAESTRIKPALLQTCFLRLLEVQNPAIKEPTDLKQFCEWLLSWLFHIEKSLKIPIFTHGHVLSLTKDNAGNFSCQIAIPYYDPRATFAIVKWLLDTVNSVLTAPPEEMKSTLLRLAAGLKLLRSDLREFGSKGVNTRRVLQAAIDGQVSFFHLEGETYVVGEGCRSRWLRSTYTDATGYLASHYSGEKHLGAKILALHGLPVAEHFLAADEDEAVKFAGKLGYPVVVKPANKEGGVGVHAGLTSESLVRSCYQDALRHSQDVLVEKHFEGRDYRLTILQGHMIKAIERIPGGITGDGQHTVRELLEMAAMDTNALRRSGERGKPLLTLDKEAIDLLAEAKMNPESVPAAGVFVRLRRRSNVSTGGTTRLVMDTVHPDNQRLAERASEVMRLDVAGIDLLIPDIARSWQESGAIICEVNSQPQIGENDTPGLLRTFLKTLLQGNGRIPIGLILTFNDSTSHAELLQKFSAPFSRNGSGTALAASGVLKLDGESLNPGLDFIRSGQAAIRCRDADRVLLAARWHEVLTQGMPVSRVDILIIDSSSSGRQPTKAQFENLAHLLSPHLDGYIIYSADDKRAVDFANYFPLAKRCMVSIDKNRHHLKRHLADGGLAVWINEINSGDISISAGRIAANQLFPTTLMKMPGKHEQVSLLMFQAVQYLAEEINVRNRCSE